MRFFGLMFLWLALVALGGDVLASLEAQSPTLVRLAHVAALMEPGKPLPPPVAPIPLLLPFALLAVTFLLVADRRSLRRSRHRRRFR